MQQKISIVIPAYNEQDFIGNLLEKIDKVEIQSTGFVQIKLLAELSKAVAVDIAEVTIVGSIGKSGEIELDGEVKRLSGRQVFHQVGNGQ